jgi:hypothetical protein
LETNRERQYQNRHLYVAAQLELGLPGIFDRKKLALMLVKNIIQIVLG